MFNLFKNKTKVKAGKQTQSADKPNEKRESPLVALKGSWKKLNSMDRKQAYTWGAIVLVGFVSLLFLASAASSSDPENFSDYESRGYDLANMPFSSDEAEQYLLASKYPDMQDVKTTGLYSEEEKAARQAEDAEEADDEDEDYNEEGGANNYRDGRYGGSGGAYAGARGGRGSGTKTQVEKLNSSSLKGGGRGSGMSGTFGPRGDFSNFKSQNKGYDKAPAMGPGSGDARKALYQVSQGSRAAAGLKDNKLANAKKAMMGGTIEGSKAFTDTGVNLGDAKGLNLDTNAPIATPGLSGLDDALKNAKENAEKEDKQEEEKSFLEELGEKALTMIVEGAINLATSVGQQVLSNSVNAWQMEARAQNAGYYEGGLQATDQYKAYGQAMENYQQQQMQYQANLAEYNKKMETYDPMSGLLPPVKPTEPVKPSSTVPINIGGQSVNVDLSAVPTDGRAAKKWGSWDDGKKVDWILHNDANVSNAVNIIGEKAKMNSGYGYGGYGGNGYGYGGNTYNSGSYGDQISYGGGNVYGRLSNNGMTLTTRDGRTFNNTGTASEPNWVLAGKK